jgi:hypothetical protein
MRNGTRQYAREAVLDAARRIVDYFWLDEHQDYGKLRKQEIEVHILQDVALLDGWLEYQETCRQRERRIIVLVVFLLSAAFLFLPELLLCMKSL